MGNIELMRKLNDELDELILKEWKNVTDGKEISMKGSGIEVKGYRVIGILHDGLYVKVRKTPKNPPVAFYGLNHLQPKLKIDILEFIEKNKSHLEFLEYDENGRIVLRY